MNTHRNTACQHYKANPHRIIQHIINMRKVLNILKHTHFCHLLKSFGNEWKGVGNREMKTFISRFFAHVWFFVLNSLLLATFWWFDFILERLYPLQWIESDAQTVIKHTKALRSRQGRKKWNYISVMMSEWKLYGVPHKLTSEFVAFSRSVEAHSWYIHIERKKKNNKYQIAMPESSQNSGQE